MSQKKTEQYGTPINHTELNYKMSESELTKLISDSIDEVVNKFKIIRISAAEEATKESEKRTNEKLEKKLKDSEKGIIKLMQSKPGILKRSPEKQQEWINAKIEKLKSELSKQYAYMPKKYDINIKDENIRFFWYSDIYTEHTCREYSLGRKDDLIECIINDIKKCDKDEAWRNIQSIDFCSKSFIDYFGNIYIVPLFDEETEEKLSQSVKKFGEFLSNEYGRGKYIGD